MPKVEVKEFEKKIVTYHKNKQYNVELTEKEYIFFMACIGNSTTDLMLDTFNMDVDEIDIFESMYYNRKIEQLPEIETLKKRK